MWVNIETNFQWGIDFLLIFTGLIIYCDHYNQVLQVSLCASTNWFGPLYVDSYSHSTVAVQADTEYHQEFKPPPDGSATGVGKQEQVVPIDDPAHDKEQVQQRYCQKWLNLFLINFWACKIIFFNLWFFFRLSTFQDNWNKLQKWFMKFGTLKNIDASLEMESVQLELENILEETVKKVKQLFFAIKLTFQRGH